MGSNEDGFPSKLQSPLDLLSNCAVEEISSSIHHQQQHSDTTIFCPNAVSEAELTSDEIAHETAFVNQANDTFILVDSKGNIINTGGGFGDNLIVTTSSGEQETILLDRSDSTYVSSEGINIEGTIDNTDPGNLIYLPILFICHLLLISLIFS